MPLIVGFNGIRLFVKGDEYPRRVELRVGQVFETETIEGSPILIFWDQVQFIEIVEQKRYDEIKRRKAEVAIPPGVLDKIIKGRAS